MTVAERIRDLQLSQFAGNGEPLPSLDPQAVRDAIEDTGAVLIRGYSTTLESFAALGESLCSNSLFNESPNRGSIEQGGQLQSVNLGEDPFPLHPEVAREPWRPDLAMFTCVDPPGIGGQTNLCDGIAIADSLPADLRSQLEKRRLIYIKPATAPMLSYWLGTESPSDQLLAKPPPSCPYWFRRVQGRILRGFIRPVLEETIFQKRLAFANFLLFARDYLGLTRVPLLDDGTIFPEEWLDEIRATARRLTYAHQWQKGDVLLADNSRVMHGRRAIADAAERRIATYFGYLKGVSQRPGEPDDPIWRRSAFVPPEVPEGS
jgi:alpha-ketoglutarate-dependent taurine dioxygenase